MPTKPPAQISLPSGQNAYCLNKPEAVFLAQEMPGYFDHGIDLPMGTDDSPPVVFDVGANIGLFTMLACHLSGGAVRVFAFEPIPETFEVLALNAAACGSGVSVYNHAIGQSEGMLTLTHFPQSSIWSSACRPDEDADCERERMCKGVETVVEQGTVMPWLRFLPAALRKWLIRLSVRQMSRRMRVDSRVRPLSSVIAEQGVQKIDLLKIDVEGAEIEVLAGISDTHWPLIRQVVIEVEKFDTRSREVELLLRRQGFNQIVVDQDKVDLSVNTGRLFARRTGACGDR